MRRSRSLAASICVVISTGARSVQQDPAWRRIRRANPRSRFRRRGRTRTPTTPSTAAHGMVATDAPIATHVGATVLRNGGNAVDAAVATAFALAVVHSRVPGISVAADFSSCTWGTDARLHSTFARPRPLASTRDMYLGATGHSDDRSITGRLSAGVPGSVAGLWEAHERFGSRPWPSSSRRRSRSRTRASSSIRSSRGRFAATARGSRSSRHRRRSSSRTGTVPQPGDRWRNPDLAAVLRRISANGPKGFYAGRTAELIAAEMHRGARHHDAARIWRATRRNGASRSSSPIAGTRSSRMPPPSSGGITMALVAHELAHYDMRALRGGTRPSSCTSSQRECGADSRCATRCSAIPTSCRSRHRGCCRKPYADSLASTIVDESRDAVNEHSHRRRRVDREDSRRRTSR